MKYIKLNFDVSFYIYAKHLHYQLAISFINWGNIRSTVLVCRKIGGAPLSLKILNSESLVDKCKANTKTELRDVHAYM